MAPVQPLRLAIAGLGTVGAATGALIRGQAELLALRAGRPLALRAVSARNQTKPRGFDIADVTWFTDPVAMAREADVDVVVELIGGADGPARAVVETALAAGRHVVTANKALLAHHGNALARQAEQAGLVLAYEAAVAGGIPIIKALREGLAANALTRVYGILNGTCNYILTTMRETGREFADVLAEAQRLGYAEADPSFDVDGIDAAHKLSILSAVAFGAAIDFPAVRVEGIRHVSAADIAYADELGYRIKLLGIAHRSDIGLEQRVQPCMVPVSSPIANVDGVFNAVVAEGSSVGMSFYQGPRRRRRADRVGGGRRSDRHRARPSRRDLQPAGGGAREGAGGAERPSSRRVLHPLDGGRSAGRDRRRRGGAARRDGIAPIDAAARPRPGGAGGADHARDRGGRHAARARAHRAARCRARAAPCDPDH